MKKTTKPFLVLLDRDGTINIDKHYLSKPDQLEFLQGAVAGMKLLYDAGCTLAVVSNQSGVARGYFTEDDVVAVNDRLRAMLAEEGIGVNKFYFCPHGPDEGCDCRKPATGMLELASQETGIPMERAVMIGDKASDVEAGINAGASSILVLTGKGIKQSEVVRSKSDFVAKNLKEAAQHVIENYMEF